MIEINGVTLAADVLREDPHFLENDRKKGPHSSQLERTRQWINRKITRDGLCSRKAPRIVHPTTR